MISFLVAWNPRRAPWTERLSLTEKLKKGKEVTTHWGMVSKSAEPGDRIFFIRLGVPPKGIFASGSAISTPYSAQHWDQKKRSEGKQTRCIDIAFNELLDPETEPIISLERLEMPPFDEMHWTIQGSGVMIPGRIADALDTVWYQHCQSRN